VRSARLWARLLGVEQAVVERVEFDDDAEAIVVAVRPRKGVKRRCGKCGRRCSGFDQGEGRRRWRALDLGVIRAYLEAEAPRVCCPEHGVVVAAVPWARHGAGHTRAFDDTAAWLAVHTSKQAVGELLRVAWATVGRIVTRVVADAEAGLDRFAGLRRIGIDEISYKRGHKYLTVVVDQDTGRLVWAAPGHDTRTLGRFFDALGQARCAQVRLVSADAARVDRNRGGRALPPGDRVPGPLPRRPSGPPTRWTRCAVRSGTPPARAGRPRWRGSARVPATRCGSTPVT
jgi:transposase